MPVRLWTNFTAGQRPRWEFGQIDSPQYQLGFAEVSNFIIENGALRKRPGVHRAGIYNTGGQLSSFPADAFASGWSKKAWNKSGFLEYLILGDRSTGATVQFRTLTPDPTPDKVYWAYNDLMAYKDSGGNERTFYWDGGTGVVYTRFGYIAEAGGRRFFVRQGTAAIEVDASRTNDLTNFTRQDPSGLLYDDDPIDIDLSGHGEIMWLSEGFGLFMGTTRGIYELVSGLGPGFSPYPGGFFPQSLDNHETISIDANGHLGDWRHVCFTKETIVTVSDVDTITILHRQARGMQSVRLDIPVTHAIDSMAWFGGGQIAVLVAHIANRSTWHATAAYDATQNFIYLIDENTGAISRLNLPAYSIAGSQGRGLYLAMKNAAISNNNFAGFLPWKGLGKYLAAAAAEPVNDYYDHLGYDSTNRAYTAKITTTPIHWGPDLNDVRRITKVVVRVENTRHFKIGVLGGNLSEWTYAVAEPALYTGDVELYIEGAFEKHCQLTIEDDSFYPCNILAVQILTDMNPEGTRE